jgi:hypothetical protein
MMKKGDIFTDKEPRPEMLVGFSWAATKRFFAAGVGAMSRV